MLEIWTLENEPSGDGGLPFVSKHVIMVSIDGSSTPCADSLTNCLGFRWDYLQKYNAPNLAKLASGGLYAGSLRPVFPSLTFPNHYTLVRALHMTPPLTCLAGHWSLSRKPRHRFAVLFVRVLFFALLRLSCQLDVRPDNRQELLHDHVKVLERRRVIVMVCADCALAFARACGGVAIRFGSGFPVASLPSVPFRVTSEKWGKKAGVAFWPGSEAVIQGKQASYWLPYNGSQPDTLFVRCLPRLCC